MKFLNSRLYRWYFEVFRYVAKERLRRDDLDERVIHTHLVIVLTTGILMWIYVLIAWFTISSPVPGIVGGLASLVHGLSPLLYRFTRNPLVSTNVLLASGMVHQATFSFFTGGFESHTLIWFGILPLFAGMLCGRRGAALWSVITIAVALAFLFLHRTRYPFPRLITTDGRFLAQAFLVFGWIFLSSSIVIVYAGLREKTEALLREQGQKIDDLFRVLFHDLANPLGRIAIGLSMSRKSVTDDQQLRGLELAKAAADNMIEVTENIRKMYALSKGKESVDLARTSLAAAVEYIRKVYAVELDRKKLRLAVDRDALADLEVLVEPVSFMNQVLGNVVSNAIKFSPEDGVITVTGAVAGPGEIALEVRDSGIGIPEELVDHLFNLNKKTSRPGTNGESGTGFGMHIVKTFVEMYGGQVAIDSRVAAGSSGTTVRLLLKGEKRATKLP
jgi:signal transduction histidine kinase